MPTITIEHRNQDGKFTCTVEYSNGKIGRGHILSSASLDSLEADGFDIRYRTLHVNGAPILSAFVTR